jgi:hypothetical protein
VTSVAFSGVSDLEEHQYNYVAKCIKGHIRRRRNNHFITGAAYGVDTLCAYLCYAWRREAHHTLVVPNDSHNEEVVHFAVAMDFEVVIMPEGTDYMSRNSRMVSMADTLIAFPPTSVEVKRGGSGAGTWSTIRRARKKVIPTYIYPLDRTEPWKENIA